jgi:hypothetical protein
VLLVWAQVARHRSLSNGQRLHATAAELEPEVDDAPGAGGLRGGGGGGGGSGNDDGGGWDDGGGGWVATEGGTLGGASLAPQEWDMTLHVARSVPPSEAAQIDDRLEGWARALLRSDRASIATLAQRLRRPLRPLWFGADGGTMIDRADRGIRPAFRVLLTHTKLLGAL